MIHAFKANGMRHVRDCVREKTQNHTFSDRTGRIGSFLLRMRAFPPLPIERYLSQCSATFRLTNLDMTSISPFPLSYRWSVPLHDPTVLRLFVLHLNSPPPQNFASAQGNSPGRSPLGSHWIPYIRLCPPLPLFLHPHSWPLHHAQWC